MNNHICHNCGRKIENPSSAYYADDDEKKESPFCSEECLLIGTEECVFCNDRLLNSVYITDDIHKEYPMCKYHAEKETTKCYYCERRYFNSGTETTYTTDDLSENYPICPICAEILTSVCNTCGERHYKEDLTDINGKSLCYDCLYEIRENLKEKIKTAVYEKGSFQGVWNGGNLTTEISITGDEAAVFFSDDFKMPSAYTFYYDSGKLIIHYND